MKIKFINIVLFWLILACLFTIIMYIYHPPYLEPYGIYRAFRWEIVFAIILIPSTPFVFLLANKFPINKKTALSNGIVLFITGVLLTSLQCILHGIIIFLIDPGYKEFDKTVIFISFYFGLDKMLIVYCALIVLQHASNYYSKFQENKLKASKLETELARAQMQALKMQLHPHFLFNTLNAIVTLIHKDPDTAEQMIIRLSDFLRLTLKSSGKQMITLQEEMQFSRAYLEIEQIRFHDRLSVKFSVEDDLCNAEVPNLLLQPIIENAIKHGITPNTSGGTISISAIRTDSKLNITVCDNGNQNLSIKSNNIVEGVGLSNTRGRLERIFGNMASLNWKYNTPCGFEVNISLPFRISGI